jgi:chromosomal replication initiator protein
VEMTPWKRCLEQLEGELTAQQFDTWIRPLHAIEDNNTIQLLAPNRFVQDWIGERYLSRIEELLSNKLPDEEKISVKLDVGSRGSLALTKQQPTKMKSKNPPTFQTT